MVEMLGVLAIIGVLSVAGIQGYRYATVQISAHRMIELTRVFLLAFETERQKDWTIWDVFDENNNFVGCRNDVPCITEVTKDFCTLYGKSFCQKPSGHEGKYGPVYWFGNGNTGFSTIPDHDTELELGLYIRSDLNEEICQAYLRLLGGMDLPEEFMGVRYTIALKSFSDADIRTYCTSDQTINHGSLYRKMYILFKDFW